VEIGNRWKFSRGFTLLEILISLGVFVLFASGIFTGIQYVFKSVYASRLRIIENGILNEQVEIVRNLPFAQVGIMQGSPPGVLTRTATMTKNGIEFLITRTIRNIDDPFDGTATGEPPPEGDKVLVCHRDRTISVAVAALSAHLNHGDTQGSCEEGEEEEEGEEMGRDLSPGDYKFVQIDVICARCGQRVPVSLLTHVGPKYLEGDPTHGALLVEVRDSLGQPVPGADAHIVAYSTSPTYDFVDTTNNSGQLLVPDLAAGNRVYAITISKSGYITDATNDVVANPARPPASVIAQNVQQAYFEIDRAASINLQTIRGNCNSAPNVSVRIQGTNKIGTDPDVYRVDETIATDNRGEYVFSNLRWDDYGFEAFGKDLLGVIPIAPARVLAGSSVPVQLVVGVDTTHSLLVNVKDGGTSQPIPGAVVRVTRAGYDETETTGVGHIRQTDWSGGDGQEDFLDETRYAADDGGVDAVSDPGNVMLERAGEQYLSTGELESSTFDLGLLANPVEIQWEPIVQPPEAGESALRFQFASSGTSTPAVWNFLGPDGTGATYYDNSASAINDVHDNDQYIRYKLFLSTASSTYTPVLSDLSLSYTVSCTPPGQAYFGHLSNTTYAVNISAAGYQTYSSEVVVSGDIFFEAPLVSE